jgi:ABC-2 type transport system ATP-binding protein
MGKVVSVENLTKRYGDVVAVNDVSFSVAAGEIFGILGPNGSGKTTTVECLQGLRRADGGRLSVLGFDPAHEAAELRRHIGAQLQESALPDRIRVGEALAFFSSLAPGGPPWESVLEAWGLSEKRSASFASLSGGQQQRLFVALAVVNAPALVFLDEMTTGLDPSARHVAWDLIRRLRDGGTTVVLVTHFMDEAEQLCDRLAVIADKRVVATGTPAELATRFAPPPTVVFSADPARPLEFLDRVTGVEEVSRIGSRVAVRGHGPLLAHVAAALVADGLAPEDLELHRGHLEDAYFALVGTTASNEGDGP